MNNSFDVGIIGAGPGGYTLAIRLAQKGKKVVIFEKKYMGGACLNVGCIPTKVVLHSCSLYENFLKSEKFGISAQNICVDFQKIYERKNSVVEKMKKSLEKMVRSYDIEIITGEAEITDINKIKCNDEFYNCEKIVAATGSEPIELNNMKKSDFILDSNDILNLSQKPGSILIIGSGAIGIEWARIFSSLGVQVHLAEMADRILPTADFEISARIERILKRNKVKIYTSNSVENYENNKVTLKSKEVIEVDKILCAVGRRVVLPKSKIPFENDEKGRAIVDKNFQNRNGIFVIGDAASKIQLAHNAIHQAIQLADYLCNKKEPENFVIPSIIYGSPEVAMVGQTEQELEGTNYKKSIYPVSALGKAQADGEIEGFVKLLSMDDIIVGAHIISPEASSLICEFILPIQKKMKVVELTKICHPHPTYSEAAFEAIFGIFDSQINVIKGI